MDGDGTPQQGCSNALTENPSTSCSLLPSECRSPFISCIQANTEHQKTEHRNTIFYACLKSGFNLPASRCKKKDVQVHPTDCGNVKVVNKNASTSCRISSSEFGSPIAACNQANINTPIDLMLNSLTRLRLVSQRDAVPT